MTCDPMMCIEWLLSKPKCRKNVFQVQNECNKLTCSDDFLNSDVSDEQVDVGFSHVGTFPTDSLDKV